jgi:hypothetical protein
MKLLEIIENLKSGKLKLKDGIGHCFNPIEGDIKRFYDWILKCKEKNDTIVEKAFCSIYTAILEKDYQHGEVFCEYGNDGLYCFDCGKHYHPYLIDDSTLGLIDTHEYYRLIKENNYNEIVLTDANYNINSICPIYVDKQKGYLTSEIDITSGDLVFKNYFSKEKIYEFPKNVKYHSENSINGIQGRKNLMQYLSTLNIGYGQMGNMSVSIFVNKDGSEIIIGRDYSYNETDGEFEVKHKGFKNIGKISLEVWRWMCGDADVLKSNKEPMSKELKSLINNPKQVYGSDYKEEIVAKVKAGRWVIEHYYDFQTKRELIYSRMYLKKNNTNVQ